MKFVVVVVLSVFALNVGAYVHEPDTPVEISSQVHNRFLLPDYRDENSRTLLEFIGNIVDNVSKYAKYGIKNLNEDFNGPVNVLNSKVEAIALKSFGEVESSLAEAENFLILSESEGAIECFEETRNKLSEILKNTSRGIENCIIVAGAEIVGIRDLIKNYTDTIEGHVKKLANISRECIKPFNPLQTVRCVIKHVGEIRNSVLNIIVNARETIRKFVPRIQQIIKNTQVCLSDIISKANEETKQALEDNLECIKNTTSKPPTSKLPNEEYETSPDIPSEQEPTANPENLIPEENQTDSGEKTQTSPDSPLANENENSIPEENADA